MHSYFHKRGFTLIELLVVIAIIGMLSSIVFASLNSARLKGKDATIRAEVRELRNILELVYDDTGSYDTMNKGWVTQSVPTCTGFFASVDAKYRAQAIAICDKIVANVKTANTVGPTYLFWLSQGMGNSDKYYSIMVPLNNGKWLCSGSGGTTGEYDAYGGGAGDPTAKPGCWGNP